MTEITMPKLSDTMTEGQLGAWLKSIGDRIEKGEIIAEVETDKATMELEAFASGVLLERFVEAGQMVAVGTVIGIIGEPDEKVSTKAKPRQPSQSPVKVEAPPSAPSGNEKLEINTEAPPTYEATHHAEKGAPVVRRRAQELGINIEDVSGSGPGGKVLLRDIDEFANRRGVGRKEAEPHPQEEQPVSKPVEEKQHKEQAAPQSSKEGEMSPQTRMRSAIARTVSESWKNIPHFFVTTDIRMDKAEEIRRELKASSIEVPYDAMIVKASALAMQKFPLVNGSFMDAGIKVNRDVNIGVMTQTDDGLFAPVVKDAQSLSLLEIGEKLRGLVGKIRNGTITPSEMSDGTFSISNLGMHDVRQFTAIILPPQAAILAVGKTGDAMVIDNGQPLAARVMTITMSADHRVLDGSYAAGFLKELKHILENPAQLLL